jgi:hypothetical protein
MRILIFLLFVSTTAFSQTTIQGGNLIELAFPDPGKSKPEFIRVDTTRGAVACLKKGASVATFSPAIKIDSVWQHTSTSVGGCEMAPGVMCLVAHVTTQTITDRRLVAIITNEGKRIDLSKNYTFIPESEMQE